MQVGEPERKATPEDLIRATKGVTLATAKAVSAGNSGKQEDIVQAANIGRRYCTELLVVVKVFELIHLSIDSHVNNVISTQQEGLDFELVE